MQRCLDSRCGTLLAADVEVCDECGGTALGRLADARAVLLGEAGDRPVAFGLIVGRPNVIGRSAAGGALPEVDLSRFPGSESVHRRHAQLQEAHGQWSVTHLGRNPVVVSRPEGLLVVEPGSTTPLRTGDWLQIGRIRLRLVFEPGNGIQA